MSAQLTSPSSPTSPDAEPAMINGDLRCALTGKLLSPDHAYWAPPLITTRQLVTTLARTLVTNPGAMGQVLLGELPNVPYDPDIRQELGNRRTAEQLKLIVVLLVIAALLIVPIMLLVS